MSSRRNGKAASCEPCRKGKIRCDHQQPVCARCRRRGLDSQCWYHPAPLTRPHGLGPVVDAESSDLFAEPRSLCNTTSQTRFADNDTSRQALASLPGPSIGADLNALGSLLPELGASHETIHDEQGVIVADLFTLLRHLNLIQRLIQDYYALSQPTVVPGPLTLRAISILRNSIQRPSSDALEDACDGYGVILQLAESVVRSTTTNIDITSSISVSSFCDVYTGENLRLEVVGLVFAIAAHSRLLGLARDDDKREDFVQTMFRCSTSCLELARRLAPQINDAMVWLSYENLLLTIAIQGDASPNVWRRLGDLTTDVFALGIHRESINSCGTPFFLAEYRRKTFAAAYQLDKLIATLFDRPPRILKRHSDCKMPLDLADDQLLADSFELEQAQLALTSEGWNAGERYVSSTWARLRYILGAFREEILEYHFRPLTSENTIKLRNLSERCRQTWTSLPAHLRYTHACWTSSLPATVCFMLTIVHLSYLQNESQIYRLLRKGDPSSSPALLNVSAEIIAIVLQLGSSRHRATVLHHEFSSIVINYGLPSATTLITALQGIAQSGTQTPPGTPSRSALIRSLSVFTSYLESICKPGEANHITCVQGSKAISRTLDDVLDTSPTLVSTAEPPVLSFTNHNARVAPFSPSQSLLQGTDAVAIADLDILNSNGFDELNLPGWLKKFDCIDTGGEYSMF